MVGHPATPVEVSPSYTHWGAAAAWGASSSSARLSLPAVTCLQLSTCGQGSGPTGAIHLENTVIRPQRDSRTQPEARGAYNCILCCYKIEFSFHICFSFFLPKHGYIFLFILCFSFNLFDQKNRKWNVSVPCFVSLSTPVVLYLIYTVATYCFFFISLPFQG